MTATNRFFHLHLISDATGETLNTVARAAMAQYAAYRPIEHIYALIRTSRQLSRVLDQIEQQPGIVLFTIVSPELRKQLEDRCQALGLPCISILDPVIAILAQYLNAEQTPQVAGQHVLNAEYFRRMDALQFSMSHDDGQNVSDLDKADVVILGISRTSKTPTSIYLAQRGIRAANIPIVLGIAVPPQLFELRNTLIVGLIASADRIAQIRRHRLLTLNEARATDYADPRHITQEMVLIKSLCTEHGWPMIDVTRRSVEETAASILNLIASRQDETAR
ncbi:MAG: pyruvate, water dikinase regulatory protein [Hyphomicrobiales bacterium]